MKYTHEASWAEEEALRLGKPSFALQQSSSKVGQGASVQAEELDHQPSPEKNVEAGSIHPFRNCAGQVKDVDARSPQLA